MHLSVQLLELSESYLHNLECNQMKVDELSLTEWIAD
jgi:hypothetical protein